MKRAGIATVLIGIIAVTAVCCVLEQPATAAAPHHHQTLHHATIRIGVRHLDLAMLAGLVSGQSHAPAMYGDRDRQRWLLSHISCELTTPLRI